MQATGVSADPTNATNKMNEQPPPASGVESRIGGFRPLPKSRSPPPQKPTLLQDFHEVQLRRCPAFSPPDYTDIHHLRNELLAQSSIAARSVTLAALLNKISDCARKLTTQPGATLVSKNTGQHLFGKGDAIRFTDQSETPPATTPWPRDQMRQIMPSIIGISQKMLDQYHTHHQPADKASIQFPWHHIHTAVEIQGDITKIDRYEDSQESIDDVPSACKIQTAVYVGDILRSQPHLIGAYGLFVTDQHYSVMWADPTGSYKSQMYLWASLGPLMSYVWSLYFPPDHHSHHDNTISLDVSSAKNYGVEGQPGCFTEEPLWNFTCFPRSKFQCIYTGDAFTRGTAVFEEVRDEKESSDKLWQPFVIKDRYYAKSNIRLRTKEAKQIKRIHHLNGKPSPFPGVVRGVSLAPLEVTIPRKGNVEPRLKSRMLMFDSGVSLDRAWQPGIARKYSFAVSEMLNAMFDVAEVLRSLLGRGVMHGHVCSKTVYLRATFMSVEKINSAKHLFPKEDLDWLTAPWADFICAQHFLKGKGKGNMPSGLLTDFNSAQKWPLESANCEDSDSEDSDSDDSDCDDSDSQDSDSDDSDSDDSDSEDSDSRDPDCEVPDCDDSDSDDSDCDDSDSQDSDSDDSDSDDSDSEESDSRDPDCEVPDCDDSDSDESDCEDSDCDCRK